MNGKYDGGRYWLCLNCDQAYATLEGDPVCPKCNVGFLEEQAGTLCQYCDEVFATLWEASHHIWEQHEEEVVEAFNGSDFPIAREVLAEALVLLATLLFDKEGMPIDGTSIGDSAQMEMRLTLSYGVSRAAATLLCSYGLMVLTNMAKQTYEFATAYYEVVYGAK